MSETPIDGRPKLPAPEERLALPAPESGAGGHETSDEGDKRQPWWRRSLVLIAVAAALALALLLAFCTGGGEEEEEAGGGPPVANVSAAPVQVQEWTHQLTAIGTVDAVQGVDVTTELAGIVAAIRFANGGTTRAGRTLVQLDTTTERAQRAALAAQRDRARLAYQRALRLIERGAIAQAEVEVARAEWQNLVAQVQQIDTAIEKKRIDAPFAGTLGIRQVSLGQFVAPGTPIVSLQQLSPIFVNFELPENSYTAVREGLEVQMTSAAFGQRRFTGRVSAFNPDVAQGTRSFVVQATVPNRDRALRPGMFADVTLRLPGSRQVVTVPTTAITRNAYGDLIYVVHRLTDEEKRQRAAAQERQKEKAAGGLLSRLFGGESGSGSGNDGGGSASGEASGGTKGGAEGDGDGQAAQTDLVARAVFVEVGEARGLHSAITKGIWPGMRVVTAGQLKLEDGAPIRVVERSALDGAQAVPEQP